MNTDSASHDAQTGGTNVPPDARPSGTTEAVNISRDPYGLSKLRRAFEESQHRTGMVVGLPKVTIDASHVNHALVYIDALREEIQHLRSSAGASGERIPSVLFDGYAVFKALSKDATHRTSIENVSDVLDAVVRLLRGPALDEAGRAAPEPSAKDYIARLPADWFKDSSLETWFPLTAEELKRLRMEVETLRRQSGEPGGQPPQFYRLQDVYDRFHFVDYDARMWELIVVPQPLTKEVKP